MPTLAATCPFCGLLCDDLAIASEGGTLRPLAGACQRSRDAFSRLGSPAASTTVARIAGQAASMEAALDAAADVMRQARRPFLGGLATDVAGMRAVMALARRIGAVVDHTASNAKYRNLHVLQESGWITTTLAEVKNRADVLVLVGDGWHARFPRFAERVIAPATDLAGAPMRRRAILLDERSMAASVALPPELERLPLAVPMAALPAVLGMIAALAGGQPADPARMPGVLPHMLTQCVQWLQAARYGVVVWAAADLELPYAELTLQALSHLIRVLNRAGRFAGLPLAGNDGDLTANAVHTWQAGVSLPASHANGRVDFDPHRYRMREVLARGEADCLLWISSLSADSRPPAFNGPVVVLGRADMQFDAEPAVFLPVATPGVDADGHLLRSDKVISLYLRRLREGRLASVAQALHALLERMG